MNRRLAALIATRLQTHEATAPVFGTRVFPVIAPQNTPYPLVCYRRLSASPVASLSGNVGRPVVTIETKIYARSYAAALDAAEAVRKALDKFMGTLAGCTVEKTTWSQESDSAEIPQDGQMLPDYTVSQSYDMRIEDTSA
jgi:hypothetical protein